MDSLDGYPEESDLEFGEITRRTVLALIGVATGLLALASGANPVHAVQEAANGLIYPTDPWMVNGAEGTRYLDPRYDQYGNIVRRHLGVDSQGGVNQPVFAVAAGQVVGGQWGTGAGDGHGFGNYVQIAHDNGFATLYAHFSAPPHLSTGAQVQRGQQIGTMGGSGYGNLAYYGRHLHFEVKLNGGNVDPLSFLAGTIGSPTPPLEDDMFTDADRKNLQDLVNLAPTIHQINRRAETIINEGRVRTDKLNQIIAAINTLS